MVDSDLFNVKSSRGMASAVIKVGFDLFPETSGFSIFVQCFFDIFRLMVDHC
jgi:hypothetical protein